MHDRCEVRRFDLTAKVQRPEEARKLGDVTMALEKWDTHLREYLEAGGRPLSYDEKTIALLTIVPESFRADVMFKFQGILEPMPGSPQEE